MTSQLKTRFALNIPVFFVMFFMAQQACALAIISLLEDNLTAEARAWIESEPGTPTWVSRYSDPGFLNRREVVAEAVSRGLPIDGITPGNVAVARVDSSPGGISLESVVSDNGSPFGIPDGFVGYAQSEMYLDWLFRVDDADTTVSFGGFILGGEIGYSLYDVTAGSLLGKQTGTRDEVYGRFNLAQGRVYSMQLSLNATSAGDLSGLVIAADFNNARIVRAVPEPASFILMGLGLVGLIGAGFIRNKTAIPAS